MFVMLVTYFVIIKRVLRNIHTKKRDDLTDDFIDDDDDNDDDDDVDGYGNDPNVINDVELEAKNHTKNQSGKFFNQIWK